MKIICKKCDSEIEDISVVSKHIHCRTDFKKDKNGVFKRIDREYFRGHQVEVIYNCKKCGEIMMSIYDYPGILDIASNFEEDIFHINGFDESVTERQIGHLKFKAEYDHRGFRK